MSDDSPDSPNDDGIAGVYSSVSDRSGDSGTENLVLAKDGAFSYDRTS